MALCGPRSEHMALLWQIEAWHDVKSSAISTKYAGAALALKDIMPQLLHLLITRCLAQHAPHDTGTEHIAALRSRSLTEGWIIAGYAPGGPSQPSSCPRDSQLHCPPARSVTASTVSSARSTWSNDHSIYTSLRLLIRQGHESQ